MLPRFTLRDLNTLPSTIFGFHAKLPEISAVYICVSVDQQVLYVGQTQNLRARLGSHHRKTELEKLECAKVYYITCPTYVLKSLERFVIIDLKPLLNRY